jgi:hypothetical protein
MASQSKLFHDAVDRIAGHSVVLAQIIEQSRKRRELAADAGSGKAAALQVLPPSDDVGAGALVCWAGTIMSTY